jgi:aromatic-amino-acid transaminase
MFESLEFAAADPILGLTKACADDPRSQKINLGVGAYCDDSGSVPTLEVVRQAEAKLLADGESKAYLPIRGLPAFGPLVRQLLLGEGSACIRDDRAVTLQTPGGTGALRLAADFIKRFFPGARVWLSDPTWGNHPKVFQAAGVPTERYPYYDPDTGSVRFEQMLDTLRTLGPDDVVLFHASCHNPTGLDLDIEQWRALAQVRDQRGFVPFFDAAYQGLGDGVAEDVASVRLFAESGREMLVASSFSKNLGLYSERVGALTLVAQAPDQAAAALSQLETVARTNYSNPPRHGGSIVTTVLGDGALRARWLEELAGMRDRIHGLRHALVGELARLGTSHDFSYVARHRGLFSYLRIAPEHVVRLRDDHGIYLVAPGRMNVAGLTTSSIPWVASALAEVVG